MTTARGKAPLTETSPNWDHPVDSSPEGQPAVVAVRLPGWTALRRSPGMLRGLPATGLELARIGLGRSQITPEKGDKRFADPAWQDHPLYRRWGQAYLAWSRAMDRLVNEADLDWRTTERARFAMNLLTVGRRPDQLPGRQSRRPQAGIRDRRDAVRCAARATSSATCCTTVACPPRWTPARS